ncbi:glycosyltransferase [Heyndrickxia coagulans]|uniref:Glycosyltransferase n=1 Tax=Heyndrickxia coagulans TaxID=1398 RepID=A0AAW7CFY8_HEYCO|nr:glycosyltransferase [Heyndrickxia coagulans]MDL5039744.1 glycosyltransferase [Heyndrickxia coagulans]
MKILHVGEYAKGGIATYLREVISYQKQSPLIEDVYIAISGYNSEKKYPLPQENIFYYKYSRSLKNILRAILSINNYIDKINPDIIHVHSSFAGLFVRIPLFFKRKKFKVVYCSHGWSFLMDVNGLKRYFYVLIERLLSKRTDLIINISKYEYKKSLKLHIPKDKSVVIYNGISNVKKASKKKGVDNFDNSKVNLLFVGRHDKQKGLDILIDFFNQNNYMDIKLNVIGSSVLSNNSRLSTAGNVVFLGWIDNDEIDEYYQSCDAVIVPSRWEGFGLVAVEAMKNKKPVIVSNRGALPEVVNRETGYIFDLDNMNSLKKILDNINKEELTRKGYNAYYRYCNLFTSDIMNKKIISQYIRLIESSGKHAK